VDDRFIECACGQTRFAVTPYGEMNLCVAFPIPRYNLRTGTVREGWDLLKRTVDEAQPNKRYECPTCEVRPFCAQGRSDAWLETGDMSRCLPHFKEWASLEKQSDALLDPRRSR
jgi:radical SAM protein with 4Fe4S-binding SPASM domain